MYRFQLLSPGDAPVEQDGNFTSILYMPESRLSATTDAAGRYEFPHVPRKASFIAAVSATLELGQLSQTLATGEEAVKDDNGQKTVVWNPVFTAPRTVRVRITGIAHNEHLAKSILHAYGRVARFAGNEARFDSEGSAGLRLPPGHYQLVAEPASAAPYLRTEKEIDVAKEPTEQEIEMALQPGAVVVLKAVLDDATPVQGVGFSYETDASKDRRELQSQIMTNPATSPVRVGAWKRFMARILLSSVVYDETMPAVSRSAGLRDDLVAIATTVSRYERF
jgi:hypothetical protein